MNKEITFILEPDKGKLTAEISGTSADIATDLCSDLGPDQKVNCGKPLARDPLKPLSWTSCSSDDVQTVWLYRIYHNSVVDGPGVRSVVQVAGCSIRCPGCYVPETHIRSNGIKVPITSVIQEVLRERDEIDGVTILGGEPFDQPASVAEIVARLKRHSLHLTIYSGYTLEMLIDRKDANVDYILAHTDLLVDGPYVINAHNESGEYRGSQNQRLLSRTRGVFSDALVDHPCSGIDVAGANLDHFSAI
ncbi:MAG TPA: 4Fe-4S single cluster domain-containing protein [Pyrinomonadaceae bacterium]|nr:4Fe-4S single cluster domain-containing protein [Pyrinomonadaceae bacterium]